MKFDTRVAYLGNDEVSVVQGNGFDFDKTVMIAELWNFDRRIILEVAEVVGLPLDAVFGSSCWDGHGVAGSLGEI